jgi:glycosyltransferase involved in cell wall biosynthesis
MRILLVTSFPIPGEYDGTAMLPIKILRALRSAGIEVEVAYLKARRPWETPRTTLFEDTPIHTICPGEWISGLRSIRRSFRFDLVHAQHYGGATRAYPACRWHGWPMVYEIHSLLGDEVERDRLGRDWKFQAYLALERRVFRFAAHIITLGEPVRDVVIEEKGVKPDRVSVIYPGIDLGEFDRPAQPAAIPGVGPEHRVIMYIGSIVHPNQGVPLLIDALPAVFEQQPGCRCVLIGGPEDAANAYRNRLGPEHSGKLIVLANQTPDQVVSLARRADVLVHPRLACRENYSVQSKLAVYLAAGRPIVATDFADYQTLLGATQAGHLVPVDSQAIAGGILRVLEDPAYARQLAENTQPVAHEYFGMKRNLERYLNVYHQAIADGPQRSRPVPRRAHSIASRNPTDRANR